MQIISGTKREIALMQLQERLDKVEKRLADSKKCFEVYGDEDSKQWVEEDTEAVNVIKRRMAELIKYLDDNNIE